MHGRFELIMISFRNSIYMKNIIINVFFVGVRGSVVPGKTRNSRHGGSNFSLWLGNTSRCGTEQICRSENRFAGRNLSEILINHSYKDAA